MAKNSSSKKKKNSPGKSSPQTDQFASIPRLPQTPVNDGATQQPPGQSSLECLLLAIEGRLVSKIDSTNEKVDAALTLVAETNTALEDLELRVVASEGMVGKRIGEAEARIQAAVKDQVKDLVLGQLRSVGFDPELLAGDLWTVRQDGSSYAAAAAAVRPSVHP